MSERSSDYLRQRLTLFLVRYRSKARYHRLRADRAPNPDAKRAELGLAVAYEHIYHTAELLLKDQDNGKRNADQDTNAGPHRDR